MLRRCWRCKSKVVDHKTHFLCSSCPARWNACGQEIPEARQRQRPFVQRECLSPKDPRRDRKIAGGKRWA